MTLLPFSGAARVRRRLGASTDSLLERLGRPDPSDGRTASVGLDPLRVLLVGGGIALNYGIRQRDETLDAHLVATLAERTTRGVILDNRTSPATRLAEVGGSMFGSGAHTYHYVMWFPSYGELLERLGTRFWRSGVKQVVQGVEPSSPARILLGALPEPGGTHPSVVIGRLLCVRVNQVLDEIASADPRVTVVRPAPIDLRAVEAGEVTTQWYADTATRYADAMVGAEPRRAAAG